MSHVLAFMLPLRDCRYYPF